jgi:signal transduction histidine kinase
MTILTRTGQATAPITVPASEGGPAARLAAWFTADDTSQPDARLFSASLPGRRLVALARSRPAAVDALVAGAVLVSGIAALGSGHRGSTAVLILFQVALALPVIWRRRYPLGVSAVTYAVALTQWLYAEQILGGYVILLSLYTVGRHTPRRVALAAATVAECGGALTAALTTDRNSIQFLAALTAMVAAPCFLGIYLRTREAYLAALIERAKRLERERDDQALITAAAERARIAREMHDIVAHSLVVITTLAEAAVLKRHSDPELAAAAMEQVSETSRQALGETRKLFGVLRAQAPSDDLSPVPGLAQLDSLLEQVRVTGLVATLTVTGQRFAMPDGAQLAIYRIIQEALTNTIKHARGATHVQVRLTYADPVIEVHVIDNERRAAAGLPDSAGHGLIGMRERAALYGGTVTAGPGQSGGWKVSARLRPCDGARARATTEPAL